MKIIEPTLLLDETKCRANIKFIADKARKHGLTFRPHFKTHQSLAVGRWFKDAGVNSITVSSLNMANYFAKEWDDITVAFPTNILEIKKINALAKRIRLNLTAESPEVILLMSNALDYEVQIMIQVDVGMGRTGINPTDTDRIDKMLNLIKSSPKMEFKGFLGHAGQSYQCRSKEQILDVHENALKLVQTLKSKYVSQFPRMIVSLGDTPCCSVADNFEGVDEIRCGNFAFYDLTQNMIGSNSIDQIAVALACPVVALHPERNEMVIYGGGVHLSKDRMEAEEGTIFGRLVHPTEDGWANLIDGCYVKRISQEHGIVNVPTDKQQMFNIGDVVYVLPVHSCMTADLMNEYVLTSSFEKIFD